jgi:hypothetical protein
MCTAGNSLTALIVCVFERPCYWRRWEKTSASFIVMPAISGSIIIEALAHNYFRKDVVLGSTTLDILDMARSLKVRSHSRSPASVIRHSTAMHGAVRWRCRWAASVRAGHDCTVLIEPWRASVCVCAWDAAPTACFGTRLCRLAASGRLDTTARIARERRISVAPFEGRDQAVLHDAQNRPQGA